MDAHMKKCFALAILGKTALSLALVGASIKAMDFGFQMVMKYSGDAASLTGQTLIRCGEFQITTSGFGAAIMLCSCFIAFCAYLTRPKFTVGPKFKARGNLESTVVDTTKNISADSDLLNEHFVIKRIIFVDNVLLRNIVKFLKMTNTFVRELLYINASSSCKVTIAE